MVDLRSRKANSIGDHEDFTTASGDNGILIWDGTLSRPVASAVTSTPAAQNVAPQTLDVIHEEFCPRKIQFTIPGKLGVGVEVTVIENNGNLDFSVEVLGTPNHTSDLRGLFFHVNEARLPGLQIVNADLAITGQQIKPNGVIDLGQGIAMHGTAKPFDIGLAFGTPGPSRDLISGPVHFTLDSAQNLTIEDVEHLQFGARLSSSGDKLTTFAPAAPDAYDDVGTTHEDAVVQLFVLGNDTDVDGTSTLRITEVHQEHDAHGSITIAADGKSLFYTPNPDYAGLNTNSSSVDDTFVYCVSDGHGGEDHATVNVHVIPVADSPLVTIETLAAEAGDPVNEVRLRITATTADIDGSELLTAINYGELPIGVTLVQGALTHFVVDGRDAASQDVQLFLPTDRSSDFSFTATALSAESGTGDPDQTSGTSSKPIELEFLHRTTTEIFQITDQSIWEEGSGQVLNRSDFVGVEVHDGGSAHFEIPGFEICDPFGIGCVEWPSVDLGGASGHVDLKTGFLSNIHLTLGDIDATLPVNITLDTLYNKTSDVLQINPFYIIEGANFTTEGPIGSYEISFLFGAKANAEAGAFGVSGSVDTGTIGKFDDYLFTVGFESSDITVSKEMPNAPAPTVATVTFNWPEVNTESDPGTLSSDGASDNIFDLDVDLIALACVALGIPNPFDLGFVDLLSANVSGGINLTQHFDLSTLGLEATLLFVEDSSTQVFDFNSPLLIQNASSKDVNHDGIIEFFLDFAPEATLHNDTGLGFNLGFDVDILDFEDPIGSVGPDIPFSTPLGDVSIYDSTFGLNFVTAGYLFAA